MRRGRRALLALGLLLASVVPGRAALGTLDAAADATELRPPVVIGEFVCTAPEGASAAAATVARSLGHAAPRLTTAVGQPAPHARFGHRRAAGAAVPRRRIRPTARSAPTDPAAAS
jgi:hypothetical protein